MTIPARSSFLPFLALLLLAGCGKPTPSYDETMNAGMAELDAHRYPDAIAMFASAAEQDRERPEPSYYTGRCYLAMADEHFKGDNLPAALRCCDRAINSFDAATGAFPGYSRAVQAKADAMTLQGKHQAALDVATWAAAYVGPQAKMLILKGREFAQHGDIDQALLSFRQAVSVEPGNAAAHAELGLFLMRCGNDAAAAKELRRAAELNPGAPSVIAALARLGAAAPRPARE